MRWINTCITPCNNCLKLSKHLKSCWLLALHRISKQPLIKVMDRSPAANMVTSHLSNLCVLQRSFGSVDGRLGSATGTCRSVKHTYAALAGVHVLVLWGSPVGF